MNWLRRLLGAAPIFRFTIIINFRSKKVIDIKRIQLEAAAQVREEIEAKAKRALVGAMRELAAAEQVVRNAKAKVADIEASIIDGSFA